MENDKWYVPTIDEFHVGLELCILSQKNKNHYHTTIFGRGVQDVLVVRHLEQVTTLLKEDRIRIKYLDKEDIENLGFTHIGSLWFESENKDFRIRKWKGQEINIYADWLRNDGNHSNNALRFRGACKNKSELRKLLKQIGYD